VNFRWSTINNLLARRCYACQTIISQVCPGCGRLHAVSSTYCPKIGQSLADIRLTNARQATERKQTQAKRLQGWRTQLRHLTTDWRSWATLLVMVGMYAVALFVRHELITEHNFNGWLATVWGGATKIALSLLFIVGVITWKLIRKVLNGRQQHNGQKSNKPG